MKCDRCGRETFGATGSMFNTEMICIEPCANAERRNPEFERASRVESEAVARGDFNFPGVGLPADLRGEAVGA